MNRTSDLAVRRGRKPRPPRPSMEWAWFFDIDGTLVEIASRPSGIVVHHDLPPLIEQLRSLTGGAVSLITGRAISDVDEFLPVPGLHLAGQHGLEMRSADGGTVKREEAAMEIEHVRDQLSSAIAPHPGLVMEFKGMSIALHYRQAPRLAGFAHRLLGELRRKYAPDFVIQKGKRVVELRPAGTDKGVAIRSIMKDPPFAGRLPVFLGDDLTDETGFKVINEMSGISVKVGPGPTAASYRLRDVAAVREWLREGMPESTRARAQSRAAS